MPDTLCVMDPPEKKTSRMGRPRKRPTKTVRLYEDIADLATWVGKILDKDVADLLDEPVRKFLEKKRQEAADIVAGKKPRPPSSN